MKNFATGVSAPVMSSSVVTMPGDRLCTPMLEILAYRGEGTGCG